MSAYIFKEGKFYSRREIHEQLGGELEGYLPSSKGLIVCACFTPNLNPRAPEVILVGMGKKVMDRARTFADQVNPVPVFMKEGVNSWRFEGMYVCKGWATDVATIQRELINSGRENVSGVLYLQKNI
jgi:hypothetical protein